MSECLKIATVFSGIGAIEQALKRLGIRHELIFACDNGNITIEYDVEKEQKKVKSLPTVQDKKNYVDQLYANATNKKNFVKTSYLANYNLDEKFYFQDIRLLDGGDFYDRVDLLVGGSPCQSFSTVGIQGGLEDTRGTLFYDYANLIKDVNPKVFIYENVRGLTTHDKGKTWAIMKNVFNELGYSIHEELLDAKDYGVPQTRRRIFVVGIRSDVHLEKPLVFPPEKIELRHTMHDFLLSNVGYGNFVSRNGQIKLIKTPGFVDSKYILSPKLKAYVMKTGTKTFVQKVAIDLPVARTILSTMGNRHRAGVDNYVTDLKGQKIKYPENPENIRMLTEREAHRLMGFTDDYEIVVSRAQGYKQAGNSIVVDVMIAIMKEIIQTKVFGEVKYDN